MTYRVTLFLSFLLHGFVFASSYWVWVVGGSQKAPSKPLQACHKVAAQVVWAQPIRPFKKEATLPQKNKKAISSQQKLVSYKALSVDTTKTSVQPSEGVSFSQNQVATLVADPQNQPPPYPDQARQQGLTGRMLLRLTIDHMGHVVDVSIETGHQTAELLKTAAIHTVQTWRFKRLDGKQEPIVVTLPITFDLES